LFNIKKLLIIKD